MNVNFTVLINGVETSVFEFSNFIMISFLKNAAVILYAWIKTTFKFF